MLYVVRLVHYEFNAVRVEIIITINIPGIIWHKPFSNLSNTEGMKVQSVHSMEKNKYYHEFW